ncbi:acyltransferase domain-containing protein [Spartinivicinus poritis]|uniref:Acyltransferase domain-containing protein n=1 Tax=Spartinivicinus poritis TaxID=2994640 RepID=A0ABT5U863_9GAMM|nr:acyltransferase domain-containing protein [Spartinivicinus sp. A2-2]MDE1462560.1 acyltransferase domain-containing protein [Spartinivicinus sp. A2-2]
MKALPLIFMFSGQGSQYYHMGKELFEGNSFFRNSLQELDEIAQVHLGYSVIQEMYNTNRSAADAFNQTRFTHPAIYMFEVAQAKMLINLGICPDYVMGTSMGTFAAASLAGCLDEEKMLLAVIKQSELIAAQCEPGFMVAILENPILFQREAQLYSQSVLASTNFDGHFVVSTNVAGLSTIEHFLKQQQISYQVLAVSHAFHSQWIDSAQESYLDFLKSQEFQIMNIPLICCMKAEMVSYISEVYFWKVIREPIEFRRTAELFESTGSYHYLDLGPSGTLATLLKYILPENSQSKVTAMMTPYGFNSNGLEQLIKEHQPIESIV